MLVKVLNSKLSKVRSQPAFEQDESILYLGEDFFLAGNLEEGEQVECKFHSNYHEPIFLFVQKYGPVNNFCSHPAIYSSNVDYIDIISTSYSSTPVRHSPILLKFEDNKIKI